MSRYAYQKASWLVPADHLADVRAAMEELARRYEPAELNRVGFRLYEKFRPDVPPGNEGWAKKAVLDTEKIRTAE